MTASAFGLVRLRAAWAALDLKGQRLRALEARLQGQLDEFRAELQARGAQLDQARGDLDRARDDLVNYRHEVGLHRLEIERAEVQFAARLDACVDELHALWRATLWAAHRTPATGPCAPGPATGAAQARADDALLAGWPAELAALPAAHPMGRDLRALALQAHAATGVSRWCEASRAAPALPLSPGWADLIARAPLQIWPSPGAGLGLPPADLIHALAAAPAATLAGFSGLGLLSTMDAGGAHRLLRAVGAALAPGAQCWLGEPEPDEPMLWLTPQPPRPWPWALAAWLGQRAGLTPVRRLHYDGLGLLRETSVPPGPPPWSEPPLDRDPARRAPVAPRWWVLVLEKTS